MHYSFRAILLACAGTLSATPSEAQLLFEGTEFQLNSDTTGAPLLQSATQCKAKGP